MPTLKQTHSSGLALPLKGGGVAVVQSRYEQLASVDPVTAKPVTEVTSLVAQLIVLDAEGTRHIVEIVPFKDGSGVEIHLDDRFRSNILWNRSK